MYLPVPDTNDRILVLVVYTHSTLIPPYISLRFNDTTIILNTSIFQIVMWARCFQQLYILIPFEMASYLKNTDHCNLIAI